MRKRMVNQARLLRAQQRLTRKVRKIKCAWGMGGSEFRSIVRVNAVEWQQTKRGITLPLRRETLVATQEILKIHHALLLLFNGNHLRMKHWLRSPNTGTPFGGATAKIVIGRSLSQLSEVRQYLEYHAGGGW